MSSKTTLSKLVKAEQLEIKTSEWRLEGDSAGGGGATEAYSERGRIAELEQRNRQLERDVEQKPQAALQQGLRQGEAAAREQLAAQADAATQRLARAIDEISGARQRCRHEAEQDVVKLSLAIARRVLHRELTMDPTALLGLVKAALDQMDAREIHRVRVHPEDAGPLKSHLERLGIPARVEVQADAALERGSVLLESSRGTLDASVDTQLAEIERGFADLIGQLK